LEKFNSVKLSNLIKQANKIAVVAMGNEISGDDAVGVLIGEELLKSESIKADIYIAYQSPEAYLMKLLNEDYSHVIFIDAIDAGKKPGEIYLVNPNEIINEKLSTHRFPLKLLLEILKQSNKEIIFIGIQIERRGIGLDLSREVLESKNKLLNTLRELLRRY